MKKILFVCQVEFQDESDGVLKKIKAQIFALQQLGYKVDCLCYYGGKTALVAYEDIDSYKVCMVNENSGRFRRFAFWRNVRAQINKYMYDFVYIRYSFVDFSVLQALRDIHIKNMKIIIEIPSIKVKVSIFDGFYYWQYLLDKALNKLCVKYVNRVIYVGNEQIKALGCTAHPISNGMPYGFERILRTGFNYDNNVINMLAVSTMGQSRGFERILYGMADYYKSNHCCRIELTLIGEGESIPNLKNIVDKNNLQRYVKFRGKLFGAALDDEFKKATIGIGALGLFHLGVDVASTLKVKEYFIRGLPFIYAGVEVGVPEDYPFSLKFSNDNTPIDCQMIIKFVEKLQEYNPNTIINEMNLFAFENFSWKNILQNELEGFED